MIIYDLIKLFYPDVYFNIRIVDKEGVTIFQDYTTAEIFIDKQEYYSEYKIDKIEIGDTKKKELIIHVI